MVNLHRLDGVLDYLVFMKKKIFLFFHAIFFISLFFSCNEEDILDNSNELALIDYNLWGDYRVVNHRGFNTKAPENTLPAFLLSKEMGYKIVETDIGFTKDNIPVLLHDHSIDRTSNGNGNLSDYTFEQLRKFDFGSWKDEKYQGTLIPSFEEFVKLCSEQCMLMYVEIRYGITKEQVSVLTEIIYKYGMEKHTTFISFYASALLTVFAIDKSFRLGIIDSVGLESLDNKVRILREKASVKQLFADMHYLKVNEEIVSFCKNNNIPLEIWTINNKKLIESLDNYISGITTDTFVN